MRYEVYLSPRAKKQYERLDNHIRRKIKAELLELEDEPYGKGFSLLRLGAELRYIKISQQVFSTGLCMTYPRTKKRFWLFL